MKKSNTTKKVSKNKTFNSAGKGFRGSSPITSVGKSPIRSLGKNSGISMGKSTVGKSSVTSVGKSSMPITGKYPEAQPTEYSKLQERNRRQLSSIRKLYAEIKSLRAHILALDSENAIGHKCITSLLQLHKELESVPVPVPVQAVPEIVPADAVPADAVGKVAIEEKYAGM